MVIITAKRKGVLMRKTSEKILRTLLAVSVLATAVLSSGCLDDEEEISDRRQATTGRRVTAAMRKAVKTVIINMTEVLRAVVRQS